MIKIENVEMEKKSYKDLNSLADYKTTGKIYKIVNENKYNFNIEIGFDIPNQEKKLIELAESISLYFRNHNWKKIKICTCYCTSRKIYNGVKDKYYYAGFIVFSIERKIKRPAQIFDNLYSFISRTVLTL